jgi:hypothetical protein
MTTDNAFHARRPGGAARQEEIAQAREAEQVFMGALRVPSFTGKLVPPPRLEKEAMRWGGGYRSRSAEDWDWFYGLSKAEQARLRANWFAHDAGAAPSDLESFGFTPQKWLALTRGVDAARALQRNHYVKANRYGGHNPTTFLVKGRPEDYGERVEHDPSSKVQFFTDENGVVHPIRASYEHKSATPGRTYEAWENEAF